MRQPKKLTTVKQAINATSKPLARFGDLIVVQVHPQLMAMNPRDFPNGEMRSVFIPDHRDWLILTFARSETDAYLRDLYAAGGWIESIADFSDKELALHYGYMAGIREPGNAAGNAGDPSQFEEDLCEAIAQLPEGASEEARALVRRVVLQMHRKHMPDADRGRTHSHRQSVKAIRKRPAQNDSGATLDERIRSLGRNHPDSWPNEVWPHLKAEIEDWSGDSVRETGTGENRRYHFTKRDGKSGTRTYEWFRKKLAELRGK
ncbi:hypothetical protein WJH60_18880 [Burkholderia orbicola]|uniref:hypothetical protein n=1 Tax=Burkholderia cepacia complex TaxID=87882 RepID=UPI00158CAAF4|nr:hypothetical protein [Burkholderia cenocepacia]